MIDLLMQRWRRVRRAVSRTRWTARALRRPLAAPSAAPGLVILQIDGLARTQFEAALKAGRLPKLRKLVERGHYAPISFYSGLPSTTPAVQGEVMFGARCAVPAFQFLDRDEGKVVRMFDSESAAAVGSRLAAEHEPLLQGGCSYSNIYIGGAAEARFCAETLDEEPRRLLSRPLLLATMGLLYLGTILRIAALAALEVVIAQGDMIRGVAGREDWRAELKYIPSRVAVSIILREYLRVATKLAIEQGTPIVYANFLGYDEQSHRRGPGSWFAHWVLKGIDGVIGDVWRAAHRSAHRDYEVVVYSAHGQEYARMYERETGRTVQAAVEQAFAAGPMAGRRVRPISHVRSRSDELDQRARQITRIGRNRQADEPLTSREMESDVIVTALGPLGHVYAPGRLSDEDKRAYAERLVALDGVPLVLYADAAGAAWGHNRRGRWAVAADGVQILGPDHPFLSEAVDDIERLCRHRNAGDLVISGWDPVQDPVTFVQENGAHGGIGEEEMRGIALVPDGVPLRVRRSASGEAYVRGEDLHSAGLALLRGEKPKDATPPRDAAAADPPSFRVMTYNVHSCTGLDGRVRPERILQVIRGAKADVVCLQEVDAHRQRSGGADQAKFLADELQMAYHYFPVLDDGQEQYGLAILSRFPLTHVKSGQLTPGDARRRREARGAVWVELDTPWGEVHVITTHFGLRSGERLQQATALVGDQWLGAIPAGRPTILCGDLNAGPRSAVCNILRQALTGNGERPGPRRATFPSLLPLRQLDHLFASRDVRVLAMEQTRTPTAVMASDHLPLCAELSLVRSPAPGAMGSVGAEGALQPGFAATAAGRG
ncbi:MAG TPA: endonuclease/exonuclease/phosphatase family protein [Lacipirellulaceae bacterium]|nr:endonuclease/exonuclease/phosphatase family protein [Lacipirellulaceae bacterium]